MTRPDRRLPHTLLAVAVALASSGAAADATSPQLVEEEITVVGTRTERKLDQVDATISVYDREDIDRRLFRDIQDLVRYEPGVSVGGTGSRFGLNGFTIRGIGGNRVLTLVDGIRTPEEFSFGPFLSARRDFVDVDTIERVEIARGPVSSLYGSDALGGVVAVTSRAPNDYVDSSRPLHIDAKTGYSSEDDSVIGALTAAYGTERVAGMLTYTHRAGEETETGGDVGGTGPARSAADPQEARTETLNLKLAFRLGEHHNVIASHEQFDSDVDARLLSDYGTFTRGTLVDTRDTQDVRERRRTSLEYRYDDPEARFVQHANATIYQQSSQTTQFTLETRTPPMAPNRTRTRNSVFDQEIRGLFAQASSGFDLGGSSHTLTFGVDYYETDNTSFREGGTVETASGAIVPEFLPLPTRDFPLTTVENRAFFVQDEIVLLHGRLRVTPGLRFDDYEADTRADALYTNGNPGAPTPVDYDDSELTMKLGAVYEFSERLSLWGRYSEGFRAPPYDDVNVGFTNFIGGYQTIAAPNLESETSRGFELGLRVEGGWGQAQLAAFTTEYENFIQSLSIAPSLAQVGGIDPVSGLLTFQSVNLEDVQIDGLEFRGRLALGAFSDALADLSIEGAAAWARGADASDVPVNDVDPLNTVLGLRYAPAGARYDAELIWTWADGKDDDDIDPASGRVASRSYSVVDLIGSWAISDQLSIDAGVFNLFDERYVRWADTVAIGTDAADRFSRPPRNVSVTLRAEL